MEELGYMAKMRVNELARELEIENKQIIEFLSTTEYAVKSHSSNVDEEAQQLVRNKFGKGGSGASKAENKDVKAEEKKDTPASQTVHNASASAGDTKKEAAPQQSTETAKTENGVERPKKKSSITAVFNAQYSKQGNQRRDNGNNRRPGQNGARRPQGAAGNNGRPSQPRPAASNDIRKAFERAIDPEGAKAAELAEKQAAAKAAELAAKKAAETEAAAKAKT